MHRKTAVKKEQTAVVLDANGPGEVDLPSVEDFADALRRLEIAELFQDAEEMGLDRLAGHVLAEANLDFVSDKPFDATGEEAAGVEPF